MVGLVIASHGHLAEELLATATLIIGELPCVKACSVEPGASPEEIRRSISDAVKTVDSGQGVIVFADLVGGSPCTQSLSLCRHARIEVLTGVNLPMLVKLANLEPSNTGLLGIARQVREHAREAIRVASDLMRPDAGS